MSVNTKINQAKKENGLLLRRQIQPSDDNHQLEFVDEINGIVYIDDSKAESLGATRHSLEQIATSVILVVGGNQDDNNNYAVIQQQVKQKVIAIVYLGDHSDRILKDYSTHQMLFVKAESVQEAVQLSSCYAQAGDVILFSPACKAENGYKNRGDEFKQLVKKLKN